MGRLDACGPTVEARRTLDGRAPVAARGGAGLTRRVLGPDDGNEPSSSASSHTRMHAPHGGMIRPGAFELCRAAESRARRHRRRATHHRHAETASLASPPIEEQPLPCLRKGRQTRAPRRTPTLTALSSACWCRRQGSTW
eukprot:359047-Chlamydomonas_euryale.AAC.3